MTIRTLLTCSILTYCVRSFHFPQMTPKAYDKKEELEILAGQLWSDSSTLPFDFYKLSWCDSTAGHSYDPNSLGVTMRDTKLVQSPYSYMFEINKMGSMGLSVCTKTLNLSEWNQFSFFIQHNYQYRLYLDDLPSATIVRDPSGEF